MSDSTVLLTPVDAWFFRDGRPYNQHETNQTDVVSLFPPSATTVVGGLRAALARSRGWNGMKTWDAQLNDVLGDGFDHLGKLSFQGPWLTRGKPDDSVLMFPMPLHVLGVPQVNADDSEPRWTPLCLLAPGPEELCDLGMARLPVPASSGPIAGLKEPSTQWVTSSGLNRILVGTPPHLNEVIESRDLWRTESRVGLVRNEQTRTTEEVALYSPRYVRLCKDTSVAIRISGLPDDWNLPGLLALGGESRMADCRPIKDFGFAIAPRKEIQQTKRLTVTLVTPMIVPTNGNNGHVNAPQLGETFLDWTGTKVVSACVGKPQSLGGWDSRSRSPRPLRPVLPAGSTWFLELTDDNQLQATLGRHGTCVGHSTSYGFGQVALGVWPPSTGVSQR